LIEAPAISGTSGPIGKAALTSVRSKAAGEEGFRSALASEVFATPNTVTRKESHALSNQKQHRKPMGQKAAVTKGASEAKANESPERIQRSTPIVNSLATPATQSVAQVRPTSVAEDTDPNQATRSVTQASRSSTGISRVPPLDQGLPVSTDSNAKPVLVDVNPEQKIASCNLKLTDESECGQPGVLSPLARTTSLGVPIGVPIIAGGEARVLHRETKTDHVTTAAPSPNGPVHAEEVKTLTSTPNVLEVGIESGTHGWLRVRAELGQAGEVSASLLTASSHSAVALHNELPAMAAYLSTEQIGISSVVVNAAAPGTGAHLPQSGSGTHGQADKQRQENRHADETTLITDVESFRPPTALGGFLAFPAAGYAVGGGGWLSVRV
jgi:hypothetical protein